MVTREEATMATPGSTSVHTIGLVPASIAMGQLSLASVPLMTRYMIPEKLRVRHVSKTNRDGPLSKSGILTEDVICFC